jgi:hypothetical protein
VVDFELESNSLDITIFFSLVLKLFFSLIDLVANLSFFSWRLSKSTSTVNSLTGWTLPLTVTVSISRHNNFMWSVKISCKAPDIRRGTPYYFVAASNLEAIFTFGERYEASILNIEPIAPSIAHP